MFVFIVAAITVSITSNMLYGNGNMHHQQKLPNMTHNTATKRPVVKLKETTQSRVSKNEKDVGYVSREYVYMT